uniref:Uncharacterized protein n=1 Tax=Rhizophora mucronata TaxID=61149 RepID=A0A2P2PLC1_RHIMU
MDLTPAFETTISKNRKACMKVFQKPIRGHEQES